MGIGEMDRGIPSSTLATLRGILVSSLSRENLGPHDITQVEQISRHRISRKVHFREGEYRDHSSTLNGANHRVLISM
ncbi:hypothetical protein KQX54_005058 [Cotesia glomerata]|uniref:Uncharacterized protein n=1 Tax=Cotesia glomerata TaxID=32391 RepID=A0AAV7I4Q2_COTGL|nr:hypothetical protein KQX54_005058 [Cotesia glomerata]